MASDEAELAVRQVIDRWREDRGPAFFPDDYNSLIETIAALLRTPAAPPSGLVARSAARAKRDIDEMHAAIGGKAPGPSDEPPYAPAAPPPATDPALFDAADALAKDATGQGFMAELAERPRLVALNAVRVAQDHLKADGALDRRMLCDLLNEAATALGDT